MRLIVIGALALALTACGQTPDRTEDAARAEPVPSAVASEDDDAIVQPEMDPLDRMGDSCGMASFRQYLGTPASDIPEDDLSARARIVGPDTQVTMDYAPRRLNILTDETGTVIGFKCG